MIPSGPGDLARLQAFQSRFGSDEIVVLAFHSDRLFSIFPLRTRLHEVPPWPLEASSFMARRCIAR
jgi:hypothetical protein